MTFQLSLTGRLFCSYLAREDDMSFHLTPNKEITNDKIFEKTLKLWPF